jgi:Phage tail assembly chaperone protein
MTDIIIKDALAEAKQGMRLIRNKALSSTDYLLVPDYPHTDEQLIKVKAYRKYLRDLTDTMSDEDYMCFSGVKTLDEFISE